MGDKTLARGFCYLAALFFGVAAVSLEAVQPESVPKRAVPAIVVVCWSLVVLAIYLASYRVKVLVPSVLFFEVVVAGLLFIALAVVNGLYFVRRLGGLSSIDQIQFATQWALLGFEFLIILSLIVSRKDYAEGGFEFGF